MENFQKRENIERKIEKEEVPAALKLGGFESGLDSVPTQEDVRMIFEKLFEKKEFKELRRIEDERGLYLWEVRVPTESGDVEYSYMRKGEYKQGSALDTVVNIVFLDSDGQPIGGHSVAKFIDGKWNLTP